MAVCLNFEKKFFKTAQTKSFPKILLTFCSINTHFSELHNLINFYTYVREYTKIYNMFSHTKE